MIASAKAKVLNGNVTFISPPDDAGQLKHTCDGDVSIYQGTQRTYRVTRNGKKAKAKITVQFEGVNLPETDTLELDSVSVRERLSKRLAGQRLDLVSSFEQDLRQIANDEASLVQDEPEDGDQGETPTARCDNLIDLILHGDEIRFLLARPGEPPAIANHGRKDGQSFPPPELPQLPFLVPDRGSVEASYGTDPRKLWDRVGDWITRCAVPPDGYLDLLIAWVFHTHCTDRIVHSPILTMVGAAERGKTRLGKAVLFASRRGVWTETPRQAHLLRYAHDLDATLFLDLWDAWTTICRNGVQDIILQRFEPGAKVPRVTKLDAGPFKDTTYYDIYGPTIIGSNNAIPEPLFSRCLHIPTRHQPAEGLVYPEEQDALPVRAALIAWRAGTFSTPLPVVPHGLKGRMADICSPLVQVTSQVAPDRVESVLAALNDILAQRHNHMAETREGRVLSALIGLQHEVQSGLLPVSRVTEATNENAELTHWLTGQEVGNVLKELGFKKRAYGADRRMHIEYDVKQVQSLAETKLGITV